MAKTQSGIWFIRMMLRTGRYAMGKTQAQVADEVFISTDTYRDYESERTSPPAKNIPMLGKAVGYDEEKTAYMVQAALGRKPGQALEAEMRYNALYIALAERYYGFFFKFDALMFPGLLQLQEFHYTVVREAEPLGTEEYFDGGWEFKDERQIAAESRTDQPTMHFLIGETALLQLRMISEELYQKQMRHLRRWARRKGVFIRILRGPVPANLSSFSLYLPSGSKLAGPPVAYAEIADSSYLIDDPTRIARYDEIRKALWKMAIRIEVYNDDDWRYRLA